VPGSPTGSRAGVDAHHLKLEVTERLMETLLALEMLGKLKALSTPDIDDSARATRRSRTLKHLPIDG
jgi:hypothetical protein